MKTAEELLEEAIAAFVEMTAAGDFGSAERALRVAFAAATFVDGGLHAA